MKSQNTLSITEARKKIFEIVNDVQKPGNYYTFTENGRPKVVLMSVEEFDSLQETMEILSDPKIMSSIEQAEKDYAKGDYVSWEDMKKELHSSHKPALMVADKGKKKYTVKKKK